MGDHYHVSQGRFRAGVLGRDGKTWLRVAGIVRTWHPAIYTKREAYTKRSSLMAAYTAHPRLDVGRALVKVHRCDGGDGCPAKKRRARI